MKKRTLKRCNRTFNVQFWLRW